MRRPVAAALALAALLTACGGGSSKAPRTALRGQVLDLAAAANGDLRYDRTTLAAHAGTVTILFTNRSPEVHNVTVSDGSGILGATPTFQGGSRALTLTLRPGTYTFYCSVPGHEAAGMKGTLVVAQRSTK